MKNQFAFLARTAVVAFGLLGQPVQASNPLKACGDWLSERAFPKTRAVHRIARTIDRKLYTKSLPILGPNGFDSAQTFSDETIHVIFSSLAKGLEPLESRDRVLLCRFIIAESNPAGFLAPFLTQPLRHLNRLSRVNAALRQGLAQWVEVELHDPTLWDEED